MSNAANRWTKPKQVDHQGASEERRDQPVFPTLATTSDQLQGSLLNSYEEQNGPSPHDVTSSGTPSSSGSTDAGESGFEILAVRDRSTDSSATSQDQVDSSSIMRDVAMLDRCEDTQSGNTYQMSPKLHGKTADGGEVPASIDLENLATSLKIQDSNLSKGREPVFPPAQMAVPGGQHTVPGHYQPMPTDALAPQNDQSERTSSHYPIQEHSQSTVLAKNGNKRKFDVFDVNSDILLTNGQDQVDAKTSKEPLGVQPTQDNNIKLSDIAKGQFQFDIERERIAYTAGHFPDLENIDGEPGLLIYSVERNLPAKEVHVRKPEWTKRCLGRGGNGEVYQVTLRGRDYAMKVTGYRKNELNLWSSMLDHPNILPLLAVMIGDQLRNCYQFMPLMTGSLRSLMFGHSDLYQRLTTEEQWEMVLYNTLFILKEILHGLIYLEKLNIQHSDLKARNILVKKTCDCGDLLHCDCHLDSKFAVQIADFDSAKQTKSPRKPDQFANKVTSGIQQTQGTPGYRAPEQFKLCPKLKDFEKVLQDGEKRYDMEGPWCDIWSLGVMVVQMVDGSEDEKRKCHKEANMVSLHDRHNECLATILRLKDLLILAQKHPELKPLAEVASGCLETDPMNRATASQVCITLNKPPVCEVHLSK